MQFKKGDRVVLNCTEEEFIQQLPFTGKAVVDENFKNGIALVKDVNFNGDQVVLDGNHFSKGIAQVHIKWLKLYVEPTNKPKPHIHADLIKEWADGAEIQRYSYTLGEWIDELTPYWNPSFKYRIKPEPDTPLDIPWDYINPKWKYAAMDKDKGIYLYETKPRIAYQHWEGYSVNLNTDVFISNTKDIIWNKSLTKRPE